MGEGSSRRERKKQETHQRLLETAWDLFQHRGYDDTTVEEIAEAADVAKGTFFNYFRTKEAMLRDLVTWRTELVGTRVLGADDVPHGAVARIKLVFQALADEFSPERELTRHLFMARIGAPIRHGSAHRLGSLLHELVIQGQGSGEVRTDLEPGLIARLLMTCFFHDFIRWAHPHHHPHPVAESPPPPGFPMGEKMVQTVDALMDGLGGESWRD